MDLHEVWQENKRWIIGVLIGVVVFFIAHTVSGSVVDSRRVLAGVRQDVNKLGSEPLFDNKALAELRTENELLSTAQSALVRATTFAHRPEFDLAGKGSYHLHFDQVSREVLARVLTGAEKEGVELERKNVLWPAPTSQEDTQAALIALDLLDDAVTRAYAASAAVRQAQPDARGLVAVDELRIEGDKRGSRMRRRSSDGSDRLKEFRVSFKMRMDAPTLLRMLESFRSGSRPICLGAQPGLTVRTDSKRPQDPLVVTGVLVALQVEPVKEDA